MNITIADLALDRDDVAGSHLLEPDEVEARIADLRRVLGPDIGDGTPVPLEVWLDLPSGADRRGRDQWAYLRAAHPRQEAAIAAVRLAARAVRRSVGTWLTGDDAVLALAAVDAAEAWAADPTDDRADAARVASVAVNPEYRKRDPASDASEAVARAAWNGGVDGIEDAAYAWETALGREVIDARVTP